MRTLRSSAIRVVGLIILLIALATGAALAGSIMAERVVNRKDEPVYVISNIPAEDVMRPICREAMLRKDHCRYIPLSQISTSSKKLLSYDWRKGSETVLAVDRSKLKGVDQEVFGRLMMEIFPTIDARRSTPQVAMYIQKLTKKGREFQVLLDIPERQWFERAVGELWSLSQEGTDLIVASLTYPIQSVALFASNEQIAQTLLSPFKYGTKQTYGFENYQEFRDATGLTHKILAINWNGPDECKPGMANELLPADLRKYCDDSDSDRVGLSTWKRFCREASADRFDSEDGTSFWVLRAPTDRYLGQLASLVARSEFKGIGTKIPLVDLTHINSLAVGTYVASPDTDEKRLVLQQEMENQVSQLLRSKVRSMESSQNWGKLIQDVLGDDTDPFKSSEGADKVVRASNADALLVLWVREATPAIEYSCTRNRETPAIPKFDQIEPSAPSPNARKLFSGHAYPGSNEEERRNSPEFQRAVEAYRDKHAQWEREKADWEYKTQNHRVNWSFRITATPRVGLKGYLKLIDLRTKEQLASEDISVSVSGEVRPTATRTAQVTGDDAEPESPELPDNEYVWKEATYSVGQQAFLTALKQGIERLASNALFADELKPWNLAKQSETINVTLEDTSAPQKKEQPAADLKGRPSAGSKPVRKPAVSTKKAANSKTPAPKRRK